MKQIASLNVGISIGLPPPLVIEEPPDVVVVPSGSAYVCMVPDFPGLYFYNNFWYRFHEGHWYRSRIYNGSWVFVDTRRVPRFVLDVPPDYYASLPPGYYRIHYGDLHNQWREWDRGRHWNRYDWYKHEHERGVVTVGGIYTTAATYGETVAVADCMTTVVAERTMATGGKAMVTSRETSAARSMTVAAKKISAGPKNDARGLKHDAGGPKHGGGPEQGPDDKKGPRGKGPKETLKGAAKAALFLLLYNTRRDITLIHTSGAKR